MYELVVLSLLMRWPLHAYLIAKITNNIIGPEERISRGTLSSLLGHLVRTGRIALSSPSSVTPTPKRTPQVFSITPSGRERFTQLMLDRPKGLGAYQKIFHIKALHLDLLPRADQLSLVEHYLDYCRAILEMKRLDAREFDTHPLKREYANAAGLRGSALELIRLKTGQWELELAWAQSLYERILAAIDRSPDPLEV